jgi:hypothetical protein
MVRRKSTHLAHKLPEVVELGWSGCATDGKLVEFIVQQALVPAVCRKRCKFTRGSEHERISKRLQRLRIFWDCRPNN